MTEFDQVSLRLFRFDPDTDEVPRYESYTVPNKPYMRVLDILTHVYDELEVPLAHRWYCGTKKCGECAVNVNGQPMLGCWEPALKEMTVEPLTNFPILRDLVVDTGPYEQVIMGLKPYLERPNHHEFPQRIGNAEMAAANRLYKCIECNVCTAAAPVKGLTGDGIDWEGYAGPAALVRFARFALDPRDETERRPLAERGGLADFPLYAALDGVCPQGIDIVRDALLPAREKILGLGGGAPDAAAASTAFVMAPGWSAFVRLTDDARRALEEAGTLVPAAIPDIVVAYSLAEG
jgi:succinate dehydrogenase/fumarate reductase iron-sulfur protein